MTSRPQTSDLLEPSLMKNESLVESLLMENYFTLLFLLLFRQYIPVEFLCCLPLNLDTKSTVMGRKKLRNERQKDTEFTL